MSNDIERFISNVEDYWLKIEEGNSKAANTKERANRTMVGQWVKDGCALEILSPLLEHPKNAVKLAAAAYLIKIDEKEKCIGVLRYLVKTDPTLVASTAKIVLMQNKISP